MSPHDHSTIPRPELEKEYHSIQQQSRTAAAVALIVLGGGATFYHFVEHFSWIDAFYFCTITLTTIGYGDLVPKTAGGKLFTIGYVLVGVGIIAFFANILIKRAVIRHELRRTRKKD